MKYIVFCAVFAALVAVSVADNLLAESKSKEQRSLLSQRNMLERARVAKKRSKVRASEDDGTELIELEENSEAGFGGGWGSRGWGSRGGRSSRRKKTRKIRKKLKDTSAEAAAVAAVESSGDAPADAPADTSAEAAADAPAQGHYFEVNSYKTRTTDVYEFHDYANDKRPFSMVTKNTWQDMWAFEVPRDMRQYGMTRNDAEIYQCVMEHAEARKQLGSCQMSWVLVIAKVN